LRNFLRPCFQYLSPSKLSRTPAALFCLITLTCSFIRFMFIHTSHLHVHSLYTHILYNLKYLADFRVGGGYVSNKLCIPQMPTPTPTAAKRGYTCKYTFREINIWLVKLFVFFMVFSAAKQKVMENEREKKETSGFNHLLAEAMAAVRRECM